MEEEILRLESITKIYGEDKKFVAVENINLKVNEGEFLAILGPTGCGKTTLLRIIVGVDKPTEGKVFYKGSVLKGINPEATIVLQSFSLFPWLTVQENVEIVLKAKGVPYSIRSKRAIELLDIVGLDGFENAYPKELSNGMRQKVCFARAMAMEPQLLCLDEPFSALDILSAETLRGELLELWNSGSLSAKTIIFVTHDIEEAVFLADRIVVMDKNPGRIISDFKVKIPHPRSHKSQEFISLVDRIYGILTGKLTPEEVEKMLLSEKIDISKFLPEVNVNDIVGLVERLDEEPQNKADIYKLAEELKIGSDQMLKVVEAAQLLGFATIFQGDIILTLLGQTFAEASILARKEIFATRIRRIPIFRWLLDMLAEGEKVKRSIVLGALSLYFPEEEAEKQLEIIIQWGRYAEIISYDDDSEVIYREVKAPSSAE